MCIIHKLKLEIVRFSIKRGSILYKPNTGDFPEIDFISTSSNSQDFFKGKIEIFNVSVGSCAIKAWKKIIDFSRSTLPIFYNVVLNNLNFILPFQ